MINLAKNVLEAGNLVIFPTETVYGLGCDATNIEAIRKIYKLKKRPTSNPLICHFKDLQQVEKNFEISKFFVCFLVFNFIFELSIKCSPL